MKCEDNMAQTRSPAGIAAATLALIAMSCHGTTHGTSPTASNPCSTSCATDQVLSFEADDDLFAWAFTEIEIEGENAVPPMSPSKRTAAATGVKVKELFIANSIVNRRPMGISGHFNTGRGKVWAYTKLQNHDVPSHVLMEWRRNGIHQKSVEVAVGHSDSWRTWSSHRMRAGDEGSWTVEVRSAGGRVLDRTAFEIDPEPAPSRIPTIQIRELAAIALPQR